MQCITDSQGARVCTPTPTCKDGFGRSVAVSGDFIAIGAQAGTGQNLNPEMDNPGKAYVFQRQRNGTPDPSDDTWSLCSGCTLVSPRAASPDCFGHPNNPGEDRFGSFDSHCDGIASWRGTLPKPRPDPGSPQRWITFLRNHKDVIAAMELFVVPTVGGPGWATAPGYST
jgi:hypothetical protein